MKRPPTSDKEYSKRILSAMIRLWFCGAAFGAGVIICQLVTGEYYVGIHQLLQYIGLPISGCIVGYLVKSAIENKEKIKKADGLQAPEPENEESNESD